MWTVFLHSLKPTEYWRARRKLMKACMYFYLKIPISKLEKYRKVLEVNCRYEMEWGTEEVILVYFYKGQVHDQYKHFCTLYPKMPHKHLQILLLCSQMLSEYRIQRDSVFPNPGFWFITLWMLWTTTAS